MTRRIRSSLLLIASLFILTIPIGGDRHDPTVGSLGAALIGLGWSMAKVLLAPEHLASSQVGLAVVLLILFAWVLRPVGPRHPQ